MDGGWRTEKERERMKERKERKERPEERKSVDGGEKG